MIKVDKEEFLWGLCCAGDMVRRYCFSYFTSDRRAARCLNSSGKTDTRL